MTEIVVLIILPCVSLAGPWLLLRRRKVWITGKLMV